MASALETKEASTVVKELTNFCSILGIPSIIRSDNEPIFKSVCFNKFCDLFGIKHELTTEYIHNQNRAERPIGVLRPIVSSLCQSRSISWEEALPMAVCIANSSENASTRWIPFNVMFGRDSGLFRSINPSSSEERIVTEDAVKMWMKHITEHNKEIIPRMIEHENIRHTSRINDLNLKKRRFIDNKVYPVGQIVFLKKDVVSEKSDALYDGPFQIHEVLCDGYKLIDGARSVLPRVYLRSQLKIPALYEKTIAEIGFAGTSVRYLDYIQSHRRKDGKLEFLVKWLGLSDSDNEWVLNSLVDKSAILEYFHQVNGKKLPKTKKSNRVIISPIDEDLVADTLGEAKSLQNTALSAKVKSRIKKKKSFGPIVPSARTYKESLRSTKSTSAKLLHLLTSGGNVELLLNDSLGD